MLTNLPFPHSLRSTVAGASPSSPAFTLVRSAFSMALTMIHQTLTLLESSPLLSAQASSRLQGILDSGGGLPLLFPRYELGFSYSPKSSLKPSDDLGLYEPVVASGSRLPHISVTLEEGEGMRRERERAREGWTEGFPVP